MNVKVERLDQQLNAGGMPTHVYCHVVACLLVRGGFEMQKSNKKWCLGENLKTLHLHTLYLLTHTSTLLTCMYRLWYMCNEYLKILSNLFFWGKGGGIGI